MILGGTDQRIEAGARTARLPVEYGQAPTLRWTKTLIVQAGTAVPWDLLSAAWHFLERWDAAVPLWRYGVVAADVGTPADRERTAAVVRDLRVLLHATELLFVRDAGRPGEDGRALVEAWNEELTGGGDGRLAFLRAFYRVKPRLCVLPRSWVGESDSRTAQDLRMAPSLGLQIATGSSKGPRENRRVRENRRPRAGTAGGRRLVQVEIGPGRFVQCCAGDEERVRADFERRQSESRRGRG